MAETKTITIQGQKVDLPIKYHAGHVLTEIEAAVLNQVRFENIRNNTAKFVKAAEAGDMSMEEALDKIREYAEAYEFKSAREGGRAKMTPEEREARKIARERLRAILKANGMSYKDMDPEKRAAAIERIAALPDVMEQAAEIVAARQQAAEMDLSELGIE